MSRMLPYLPSRRVAGRYPPHGESQLADGLRKNRPDGELTPLDGAVLHFPQGARDFMAFMGSVRRHGKLPADLREIMMLRIAALNDAAYEWMHHEPLARKEGLTTVELLLIRDTTILPPSFHEVGVLSKAREAALAFADASTRNVKVPENIANDLKDTLRGLAPNTSGDTVQDLFTEAAIVVASYNMVSRMLISLDVGGLMDTPAPWPADYYEHTVALPTSGQKGPEQHLSITTVVTSPTAPYLLFCNSLLTSIDMWQPLLPYLLAPPRQFNLILYDQRGHGKSSVPSPPVTTLTDLADDIALILDHLKIPKIRAAIGVSQGGATVLNFALRHPHRTECIVACDTQAVAPEANKAAWEERIRLAQSTEDERAGMEALGVATASRWFPAGSLYHPEGGDKVKFVLDMVARTPRQGFEAGARALQEYDLVKDGLLRCRVPALLLAGEKDGGGSIGQGLLGLRQTWNQQGGRAEYVGIAGSGHLPMIDNPSQFWAAVLPYLSEKRQSNL